MLRAQSITETKLSYGHSSIFGHRGFEIAASELVARTGWDRVKLREMCA